MYDRPEKMSGLAHRGRPLEDLSRQELIALIKDMHKPPETWQIGLRKVREGVYA